MRNIALLILCLKSLNIFGQSAAAKPEVFLGIPVFKHHVVVNPGDSLVFPPDAYIMELHILEHGDYIVYNNDLPYVYPDIPGVNLIIHRDEGVFEINGEVKTRSFEPEGNEKYVDQAIVSRKARFHLYYFTLADKPDVTEKRSFEGNEGEGPVGNR